jgi:hypothetical protein
MGRRRENGAETLLPGEGPLSAFADTGLSGFLYARALIDFVALGPVSTVHGILRLWSVGNLLVLRSGIRIE